MRIIIKTRDTKTIDKVIDKDSVIIGRSRSCDVYIPDESLSRQHCQIETTDEGYFVTDLGSANGVFLNGVRIPARVRTLYTTYTQLNLGVLECQVLEETVSKPSLLDLEKTDRINSKNRKNQTLEYQNTKKGIDDKRWYNKFYISGIAIIIMLFLGYDSYYTPSLEKHEPTKVEDKTNKPYLNPDEFLSTAEYHDYFPQKSCRKEYDICIQLGLSEVNKEGIVKLDTEFIIYVMSRESKSSNFSLIRVDEDKKRLAVLEWFLNSKNFNDLQSKGQIHLVTLSDNHIPDTVYRFNPMYADKFNSALTGIRISKSFGDLRHFRERAGKFVQVKKL